MIGLSEREIKYEVQIQRLLQRSDASTRRIVCLSAILPGGDQLEDFVRWLRRDEEGEAIKSSWRPTDLLFGEVLWNNHSKSGRLDISVGEENSFVNEYIKSFVPSVPNPGIRRNPFPNNAQELTLASAWRLMEDNYTVLVYCPQKSSVESLARIVVDLNKRGALPSVISDSEERLALAKTMGLEWFGEGHPVLECLSIGVAVHHGSLPTPFRKEIEKLLRDGILKLTISSPTLAQGLNLTATAIIFHSLTRFNSELGRNQIIESSEFKNVIGRAGRAFVDVKGLVIYPIFDEHTARQKNWQELIRNTETRNMESGLLRLVNSLLLRMHKSLNQPPLEEFIEYVANNANEWRFHKVVEESDTEQNQQDEKWWSNLSSLDGAILSLVGEREVEFEEIPRLLDEILASSLWQRRLARESKETQNLHNTALAQRAKHIWNNSTSSQRRGYFLAGVGLDTGKRLDEIADEANRLLIEANLQIREGNEEKTITAIIQFAEIVFPIQPFTPISYPKDWRDLLSLWLKGLSVSNRDSDKINEVLQFVEDGLVYRLPWGMEAVRVRAEANQDIISEGMTIEKFETGLVIPALETGSLSRSAALLMQAGFTSRQAAIKAVSDCAATFTTAFALNQWLKSESIVELTKSENWPTPETAQMWKTFIEDYNPPETKTWSQQSAVIPVVWNLHQTEQSPSTCLKVINSNDNHTHVVAANGDILGRTKFRLDLLSGGVYYANLHADRQSLDITYLGPGDNPFA